MLAFDFLFCLTGTSCASEEERSDIDPNGTTLAESRLNETRAKEIYLKELILAEDMIAEHSQISDSFDSDIDLKKY